MKWIYWFLLFCLAALVGHLNNKVKEHEKLLQKAADVLEAQSKWAVDMQRTTLSIVSTNREASIHEFIFLAQRIRVLEDKASAR